MTRRAVVAFAALLTAQLAGCAVAPPAPAGPLVVTDADDGASVPLGHAQELVLRLAANASTGYAWAVTESANLRLVSQHYVWPGGPPGSGGTEELVFAPVGTGPGRLALVYRRPWMPQDPSARHFALGVVIAQDPAQDLSRH
jgi:predicted secreted protein